MSRPHDTSGKPCWCGATEELGVVIHNDTEMSPALREALERYWTAETPAEQAEAYRDARRAGLPSSYGEDADSGQPQRIEWAQFMPGAPWFAVPCDIRQWTWPWPMLVEFGDAADPA